MMTHNEQERAAQVLAQFGWHGADVTPLAGGLINRTFAVTRGATHLGVLQRLHPAFGPRVNDDIDAVTSRLASAGMVTPRLVRTIDGASHAQVEAATWRALSWVDGRPRRDMASTVAAQQAGALVGRYHRAMHEFEHAYAFVCPDAHNTKAHLEALHTRVPDTSLGEPWRPEALAVAHDIIDLAAIVRALGEVPTRHVHGDLKRNNILFDDSGEQAICLVDFDTVARGTLAYELGDALRSWCNVAGEDVPTARLDLSILAAAIEGYAAEAEGIVSKVELVSVYSGLQLICIELATRFCVDVFQDSYFGWDATRFPSRRAHNLVRARGQLALAQQVLAHKDEIRGILQTAS